jgi:hypothetical protein
MAQWITTSQSYDPGTSTFDVTLNAPTGKVILAGGYRITYDDLDDDTADIFENRPDWSGGIGIATSWHVSGRTTIGGGWSLVVYALVEDA